jgi:hypothetical protein
MRQKITHTIRLIQMIPKEDDNENISTSVIPSAYRQTIHGYLWRPHEGAGRVF